MLSTRLTKPLYTHLDTYPAKQLARVSLVLALPAVFFWVSVVLFRLTENTILLDLFFNNHLVGYVAVALLPLLAWGLGFYALRRHAGLLSQAAVVVNALLFLLFLVSLLRPM